MNVITHLKRQHITKSIARKSAAALQQIKELWKDIMKDVQLSWVQLDIVKNVKLSLVGITMKTCVRYVLMQRFMMKENRYWI